ncbi:MAG: hypothetical protein AB7L17_23840 [Ilumatobacteraceae bacterium]
MDPVDMATERLEAELVSFAAWETAGLARMLAVLAEFDKREGWAAWECRSAQQWLSWKCGVGYTAATERLRVAHALPNLPVISRMFAEARLSWSKVRELTRVVTPEDERRWAEMAEWMTASQLARLTAAARKVTGRDLARQMERRGFSFTRDEDGSVTLSVRLPADRAQLVIEAVRKATVPVKGQAWSTSAADAFVEVALGHCTVTSEVVVHRHPDGRTHVEDGPAVAEAVADCFACDGPVTTVVDHPDGEVVIDRQKAPNRRQRRALARRHPMCQFPGCHHAGRFDAHHVVERAKGGKTKLANLTRLCWFHHRMVHLHRLILTLHRDRTVTVTTRDGRPIDRPIPLLDDYGIDPPERPDRIGGWQGDHLDINECLLAAGYH